ncbi:MAG: UDP-N-acetylmuramate--L-alanine ligase, partial [Muribaculaceae bacterium]|nr:UDP-N-acetylmuramate--L-alanine ligase [Muribaculaceae bacterium]
EAMASFMGPKRRFDLRWREEHPGGRVIVDDYAHHPEELRASIMSMRKLYPGRRLTVAFQPHLYTRTRDFAPQFADALSLADEVVMISLYPAREEPIPGISSKTILDLINGSEKMLIDKEDFAKTIKKRNFEILLTAGAGDLPDYIPELISGLEAQTNTNPAS